jgi:hypothetical protein
VKTAGVNLLYNSLCRKFVYINSYVIALVYESRFGQNVVDDMSIKIAPRLKNAWGIAVLLYPPAASICTRNPTGTLQMWQGNRSKTWRTLCSVTR